MCYLSGLPRGAVSTKRPNGVVPPDQATGGDESTGCAAYERLVLDRNSLDLSNASELKSAQPRFFIAADAR